MIVINKVLWTSFLMSGYVPNEVSYRTQTTTLLTANFPGSLMVLELTNPILRYNEFCRLLGSRYRCFWCYQTTHTFLPSCLLHPMSHTPGYWSPDSKYFQKFYFQTELWSEITIRTDLFSLRKQRKHDIWSWPIYLIMAYLFDHGLFIWSWPIYLVSWYRDLILTI